MIVAVEGPSAAGKTTWCNELGRSFMPEYLPTGREPDGGDRVAQAAYWVTVNSRRWTSAVDLEAESDIAVCDSDPLKLHYSWSLARIGVDAPSRFELEYSRVRQAMTSRRLGFVDMVLLLSPDEVTLRRQKEADATRTRRSFDLHLRLRGPLEEWYGQLETLRPGRVRRDAATVVRSSSSDRRPAADRYDADLLDALIAALPAV